MATEFNPGGPVRKDRDTRESINRPIPTERERGSMVGVIAVAFAIALLLIGGMFMSSRDTGPTASNTAPGVTTGSSSTPSPSNPPPAPGPQQGQGQSNSTR